MIHFFLKVLSVNTASIRYRALQPIKYFDSVNLKSSLQISSNPKISEVNSEDKAVVFVKTYYPQDIIIAKKAWENGVPVFLDLCDNFFVDNYAYKKDLVFRPVDWFREIEKYLSGIACPTPFLQNEIKANLKYDVPVVVIEDSVELVDDIDYFKKNLIPEATPMEVFANKKEEFYFNISKYRIFYYSFKIVIALLEKLNTKRKFRLLKKALLKSFQYRNKKRWESLRNKKLNKIQSLNSKGAKILFWFGNHGMTDGDYGMNTLKLIHDDIAKVAKKEKIVLVVCSNNEEKFHELAGNFSFESLYIEWDPDVVYQIFKHANVCLIPHYDNEYNNSKSPNRAVLALDNEIPVVATENEILQQFKNGIFFDNWEENILSALNDQNLRDQKLAAAKDIINENYSFKSSGKKWLNLIEISKKPDIHLKDIIGFYIQFIQDFYVFKNLLIELKKQNRKMKVLLHMSCIVENNQIKDFLDEYQIDYMAFQEGLLKLTDYPLFDGMKYFLTSSESSLRPHQRAHNLVKLAKEKGLHTYTFQHGIENIGITFKDEADVNDVVFASEKVFTWSDDRPFMTNPDKGITIGTFKDQQNLNSELLSSFKQNYNEVVSVFENLHWSRFSEIYRKIFKQFLFTIVENNPNTLFLLKPHPAGKWFTHREKVKFTKDNFVVLTGDEFAHLDADTVISQSDIVLTTPSTIALDAVIYNKKVALLDFGEDFSKYKNLFQVKSVEDFQNLRQLESTDEMNNSFQQKVVAKTNASADFIANYLN